MKSTKFLSIRDWFFVSSKNNGCFRSGGTKSGKIIPGTTSERYFRRPALPFYYDFDLVLVAEGLNLPRFEGSSFLMPPFATTRTRIAGLGNQHIALVSRAKGAVLIPWI
jgi:hypothetical protein